MPASISIHYAHEITADACGTMSAPLTIKTGRAASIIPDQVTLFTGDFELSRKLADAINATVAAHKAGLAVIEPAPVEEAA